jgi:hypothetical protein
VIWALTGTNQEIILRSWWSQYLVSRRNILQIVIVVHFISTYGISFNSTFPLFIYINLNLIIIIITPRDSTRPNLRGYLYGSTSQDKIQYLEAGLEDRGPSLITLGWAGILRKGFQSEVPLEANNTHESKLQTLLDGAVATGENAFTIGHIHTPGRYVNQKPVE